MTLTRQSVLQPKLLAHRIVLYTVAWLLSASFVFAQVGGKVSGRVTDPSNAVIPGAKVVATNVSTNVATNTESNGSGYFVMQLQSGEYSITATSPGFSIVKHDKVSVTVGGDATVDFHLQVAEVGTIVEVQGEASAELITPTSATTQMTVDNHMVQAIPVEVAGTMRNASAFLKLEPGYNGTSLNGGSSGNQPVTVDGADVSAVGFGSGTQTIAYAMPVPSFAVQEFQV